MKLCNLCKLKEATQKNSHIIPRYFGVSLLTTKDGKRKGFKLNEDTVGKKVKPFQDTPKEDYILCPDCEAKFGEIERKFANEFFNKFRTDKQKIQNKKIFSANGYEFIRPKGIDYENFKLLFYSIVWRTKISSLEYFNDIGLSDERTEQLRQILNKEIEFQDNPIIVLTTVDDFDKTRNYIYANSNSKDECFVWANEYLVFYDFGSLNPMIKHFADISITKEKGISIGILPNKTWNQLRELIMSIKIDLMKK